MVSRVSTEVMEAVGITSNVAENSNVVMNSMGFNSNHSNSDFR
jgi:hypothetical protein